MAAAASPHDGSALPFRVSTLERNETRLSERVETLATDGATLKEQMIGVRADLGELRDELGGVRGSLNKVFWAILTFAFTVAASAVTIAAGVSFH